MREIKFRVWDTEKRQMIYDGYCDEYSGPWESGSTYLSISFYGTVSGQIGDDGGKNGLHEHDADLPFDRFILMQYTGLHDKNGKEIYEGDILRCQYDDDKPKPLRSIIYDAPTFKCKVIGNYHPETSSLSFAAMCGEVIGNIYENSA